MPPATPSASKEVVTAALLVVGGKILSGRTTVKGLHHLQEDSPNEIGATSSSVALTRAG